MSALPSLSITLAGLGRLLDGDLRRVVELAQQAEQAGIDQIALPDHLAMGGRTDRYPYGRFPLPEDEPWLEPLTALAAMAGATSRIRLATNVLIAPLRPALLLAKTAATLDVLSGGRLDLGVGTGWQREEYAGSGVPYERRSARLHDQLRACRALWSGEPTSFHSATVGFEDLRALPRPVQPGGPALWLGVAATERNVARMAELEAGWMPIGDDLDAVARGVERAREAYTRVGRDPARLRVRSHLPTALDERGRPDLGRTLESLPRSGEVGVTVAAIAVPLFARDGGGIAGVLSRLAACRSR